MVSRTRKSGQGSDGGKHVPRVEGSTEASLVVCLEGIEKERENTHKHIFPVTLKEGRLKNGCVVSQMYW